MLWTVHTSVGRPSQVFQVLTSGVRIKRPSRESCIHEPLCWPCARAKDRNLCAPPLQIKGRIMCNLVSPSQPALETLIVGFVLGEIYWIFPDLDSELCPDLVYHDSVPLPKRKPPQIYTSLIATLHPEQPSPRQSGFCRRQATATTSCSAICPTEAALHSR